LLACSGSLTPPLACAPFRRYVPRVPLLLSVLLTAAAYTDYPSALAAARAQRAPILVEVWVPW
jgi:hypothetical protein